LTVRRFVLRGAGSEPASARSDPETRPATPTAGGRGVVVLKERTMRSRLAALVAAGLLGGWSPLAAQTSDPGADTTPPPPAFAETVVVTATLAPAPVSEIPASVDVVDAREIAARGVDLVIDLLRTLPGLALTQSGSPGKVASLFTRGTSSAQTLVLLDGVVLNDPVLGAFDWSGEATDGLERVEVVRGPFSALWGSSAVGGVVQLVTHRAERGEAAVRLEAGARDFRRVGLAAGAPFGRFDLDVAGHLRRGEGEVENDFFDSDEGRLRLGLDAGEGWRLGLLARAGAATVGVPYDFLGQPAPQRRQESRSRLAALPVEGLAGDWRFEAQAAVHAAALDLADPGDPFAASSTDTRREQARAVATRRLGDDAWVAGGVEWQGETATTAGAFGPGLDDARQTTRALFAQGSWARGRWRLDAGARRDDNSAFGGETSLKAGAVVALGRSSDPRARLRASWGQSFRAPALGDLYYPGFGNPDLRPERGESYELGVEGERGFWTARLTGFENLLEDQIQFDLLRGLPYNIGRARARGVEGLVEGRFAAWRLRAEATRLDTEDRATGEPLPRRPEQSASLLAVWSGRRGDAAATLAWVGARTDVGSVRLAGYATLDLAGSWRLGERFALFARLANALDRDYQEAAGFPAPGRGVAAGVSFRSRR